MDNANGNLRKALEQPFPKQAIKQREGARGRMLDYVETHTVIRRLNEATGGCWDFKITRLDYRDDLLIAVGELTIPGMGTRTGMGVQRTSDSRGGDMLKRGSEDLAKGVISDALKKAATLFGVALDLYGPDYEGDEAPAPKARQAPENVNPAPATVRITADQVAELQTLCDRANISAEALCKRFNRPSVPDFAPADYHVAKKGLEQLAAKANGKATEVAP